MHLTRNLLLCSALLLAMSALASAADNARGAVELSGAISCRRTHRCRSST